MSTEAPLGVGRVLQVNVSARGVPKRPVDRAWVGPMGLEGDGHHDGTVHGGPHRAVALFAIEAIRRVAAEGHPIFPGSCGENLTTEGIELARLPAGTRLAIGDRLVLELSKPDDPCETIAGSFRDGRFARISIKTHPDDSRMYARVLAEGEARVGDGIRVLPPAPGSLAGVFRLLDRLDQAERGSDLARWRAAADAGFAIEIVDDGELAIAASGELPGPAFNHAMGLRGLPHMLPRVLDHYRRAGVDGWLSTADPPWPGAIPDFTIAMFAAPPSRLQATAAPADVVVREIERSEAAAWASLTARATGTPAAELDAREAVLGRLPSLAGHTAVVAELAGRPVGAGLLYVRRGVGLLRGGAVLPQARGRGVQRALIGARASLAEAAGCEVVMGTADVEAEPSVRNLERMGLERVWARDVYRFDPASG